MESFEIVINKTEGKILSNSTVFLPMYQPSIQSLKNLTDYPFLDGKFWLLNSKLIDCVLFHAENEKIKIICIDYTVGDKKTIENKLNSFINEFMKL